MLIRGCKIRISGCAEREFVVPFDDDIDDKREKNYGLAIEREKMKTTGLGSWQINPSAPIPALSIQQRGAMQFLECTVMQAQPLLRLKSTNLMHGAVMLYEGETCVFLQANNVLSY